MDTKSNGLNKKLLQILLIPICAALFVGMLHFGVQSVTTVDFAGFSPRLFSGGEYESSGEMLYEMSNDFEIVASHGFDNFLYDDIEGYDLKEQGDDAEAVRTAMWNGIRENLQDLETYGITDNFGFRVRYLDWEYTSKNYDPKTLDSSIVCTSDEVEVSGRLERKDDKLYGDLINRMVNILYRMREVEKGYGEVAELLQYDDLEVEIGYTKEYVDQRTEAFGMATAQLRKNLVGAGVCALGTLALFVILCIVTGKKNEEGKVILNGLDRWPTELFLIAIPLLLFAGACMVAESLYYNRMYFYNGYTYLVYYNSGNVDLRYGLILGLAWLIALVGLSLLLCVVRKIKAGRFWKTCLCYRLVRWFATGLKEVYYGGSAIRKMVLVILGSCLLCATVISMPLVAGVLIIAATKMIRQYEEVCKGVEEIRSGNTGYRIPIEGNPKGEMQQLAAKVNEISEGFDLAVREELKNQRMKSELISNVSHDLKTPMTSIITYIDLMKKEGLDSENAPQYLQVLDEKSQRLKKLCEDLFEAAKASSGDIPVNFSRVEMVSLVNQGLGEYQDRFNQQGFQIIFRSTEEKFYVMADGQLLWRVIENLFGNLLKYAMENTRVYLDLRREIDEADGRVYVALDVKNISKYPLNIPAEELMERFKRGDESRSTEGSGLGLAIAKDLAALQKGQFDLTIDGDLFKATVMFEEVK